MSAAAHGCSVMAKSQLVPEVLSFSYTDCLALLHAARKYVSHITHFGLDGLSRSRLVSMLRAQQTTRSPLIFGARFCFFRPGTRMSSHGFVVSYENDDVLN